MLSNSYIANAIPRELWDIYSGFESDMILAFAEIVGSLMLGDTFTFAQYQEAHAAMRERLSSLGADVWPRTQSELSKIMKEAAEKHLAGAESIFLAGVANGLLNPAPPLAESIVMNMALARNYQAAISDLYTLYTRAMNVPLEALDNAFFGVQSGALSVQEAIKSTVSDLAERGIGTAMYPGQRTMELSAYVRMVTRTSVLQSTSELGFLRMDEYGCDLLVVSAHAGARPRCFPFQGRVFSRSGTHPKFPPWSSTSYGEPAGLLGINCGHFVSPFIDGLSRMPTQEERDPAKHDLGEDNAEWYKLSQEQRYNERKIRDWKRRADALEEAGVDNSRASAKVREWQATQRELIEASGRTRRYDREAA